MGHAKNWASGAQALCKERMRLEEEMEYESWRKFFAMIRNINWAISAELDGKGFKLVEYRHYGV